MQTAPRVVHLSQSDTDGGAARAAFRLHMALHRRGVDSTMRVAEGRSGHWTVVGPRTAGERLAASVRPVIGRLACDALATGNPVLHSPAVAPTRWATTLRREPDAVVHLHWVQKELISIADLGRLRAPAVWTLHDMWPFCGAEHYAEDARWREGYRADNRPAHESGFDLNRWTWRRKQRHWVSPLQLVCPSRWLADCVRASALMHDWPVTVIPNPIDTEFWRPVARPLARQVLGLPADVPLLAFTAYGGSRDPRKGFALLREAVLAAQADIPGLELVVAGQCEPRAPEIAGLRAHYLGALQDEAALMLAYSAADALVIPSRLDNLPNTGVEAMACGTPVIAFDVGGLPDIVQHRRNGFLAPGNDAAGLADGIRWVLADRDRRAALGAAAREHAVRTFSEAAVLPALLEVYQRALASPAATRHSANLPGPKTE
jgi:glycosyltransferase involved in cell wall biosynthesis